MTNEFTREARYAVLKSADVMQCLTVSELSSYDAFRLRWKSTAQRLESRRWIASSSKRTGRNMSQHGKQLKLALPGYSSHRVLQMPTKAQWKKLRFGKGEHLKRKI